MITKLELLTKAIQSQYPDLSIEPESTSYHVAGNVSVTKAWDDPDNLWISFWGSDEPRPSVEDLLAEFANPEHPAYTQCKEAAADEIEQMILDFQAQLVPQEKRIIYERKERLADNWATASDNEKLLAIGEWAGYAEIMADTGQEYIPLLIGNALAVQVATIDDLLNVYRANAAIFRILMGETEKWRNKYPMLCNLIAVVIDEESGEGFAYLEEQIAIIKAAVGAHLVNDVPGLVGAAIPGLLGELGLIQSTKEET